VSASTIETAASSSTGPLGTFGSLPLFPSLALALVFLAAAINPLDLSDNAALGEERVGGLETQVLAKLGVAALVGIAGAIGVLLSPAVQVVLFRRNIGLILLALTAWFMVAAVTSISIRISLPAAVVQCCYVLYVPLLLTLVPRSQWMGGLLAAMVLVMLGSWFLFLFVPEKGVFVEDLGGGVKIERMGGLSHPNGIGRFAMLAIIVAGAIVRANTKRWWLLAIILPLALATLYEAKSRTSVIAGAAAMLAVTGSVLFSRQAIVIGLAGGAAGLGLVLLFSLRDGEDVAGRAVVAATTKTGSTEELTSGTGRTEIWSYVLSDLVPKRPWTGYGSGTSPLLLEEFSSHTHNILLHPLLDAGVPAMLLVFMLLVIGAIRDLPSRDPLARGVMAFTLVSGFFEDTILSTFPDPATLLWLIVLLGPECAAAVKQIRDRGVQHAALDGNIAGD
jgi:exopolysaccharide production protein ExoQ